MFKRLQEEIKCVFERDPAARNAFEVITTYPGFHAIVWHRLSHRLWNLGAKWLARAISTLSRWLTGIEIHPGAQIGQRFFIDHGMGVVIGETAEIGNDCTLYHGVTLGGTSWQKGKRHPTLGNNVVVGAGAKVLGPIHIGSGVRIGSNSVVVKSVPANTTVIGVPGRMVQSKDQRREAKHQAMAKRIGFDAYGTPQDTPDPIERAIHGLIEHIQRLDERIEQMTAEIKNLGGDLPGEHLPSLDEEQARQVAEDKSAIAK
ncbi:serine O-acetyltransferase [Nitrosococcus oceani]|uniref:Serine acetyltransferase n=2 Tax=Nitrosococcus oceani TaxID=1229 RepID=Q3JAM7_NITOC|nr:serine O-acetyltransferase [Nitrosococcus oceani]KFI19450.1 serine acetyltransferase [Nitrosococcus oceani C-27]ABA58119.1 serine O-acetyltransferase [Nitrosococcus oceani ATCC 19707]EDZ67852.1 serine O-acetyltransferase, putative [Nitrosococcus oceani AFC27]KFI22695.1 serine acetyltransferase [Nitrosococcus oceani]GEM21292.1 serine O-acetyltransferase [Nitrosococcus oceani]